MSRRTWPLTDAGACHLAALNGLTRLSLAGTGIGDVSLRQLKGLANLTELDLRGTKVTAAGMAELQKSLPRCQIEWDSHPTNPGKP